MSEVACQGTGAVCVDLPNRYSSYGNRTFFMEEESVRKVWLLVGTVVLGSLIALLVSSIGEEKEARAAGDPVLVGAGDIARLRLQGR
jgi:hypothetical protein